MDLFKLGKFSMEQTLVECFDLLLDCSTMMVKQSSRFGRVVEGAVLWY